MNLPSALLPDGKAHDRHVFGVTASCGGGYAEVRLDGSSVTTRCAALCRCAPGDRVLVLVMANGRCAVVGRAAEPRGAWCKAHSPSDGSLGAAVAALAMAEISMSDGAGFALSDGGVLCPSAGAVVVHASALLSSGFSAGDVVRMRVMRGSAGISEYASHRMGGAGPETAQLITVHDVAAGDVLTLQLCNSTAARGATSTDYNTRLFAAYI